jgi:hypothetical protein
LAKNSAISAPNTFEICSSTATLRFSSPRSNRLTHMRSMSASAASASWETSRATRSRLMFRVGKGGSTGLVNLTKLIPVVGDIVRGGLNAHCTREIGRTAAAWLRGDLIPRSRMMRRSLTGRGRGRAGARVITGDPLGKKASKGRRPGRRPLSMIGTRRARV